MFEIGVSEVCLLEIAVIESGILELSSRVSGIEEIAGYKLDVAALDSDEITTQYIGVLESAIR